MRTFNLLFENMAIEVQLKVNVIIYKKADTIEINSKIKSEYTIYLRTLYISIFK